MFHCAGSLGVRVSHSVRFPHLPHPGGERSQTSGLPHILPNSGMRRSILTVILRMTEYTVSVCNLCQSV